MSFLGGYSQWRLGSASFDPAWYGLDALIRGEPVTLYHGSTALFDQFDPRKTREALVAGYYGGGIFLSPKEDVAAQYAYADRNAGIDPSIIDDLRSTNPNAAAFLKELYRHGSDAWERYMRRAGFWRDNPPEGEGVMDVAGFSRHVGVDPNTIADVSRYIIGSAESRIGEDDSGRLLFDQSTGLPAWVYDEIDAIGVNSFKYRPKVYAVETRCRRTLVTANDSEARNAKRNGYDCVIFHGDRLVNGVPEIAVHDASNLLIKSVRLA